MNKWSLTLGCLSATALLLLPARVSTQGGAGTQAGAPKPEAVVPGELVVEPPTLINLGFEWFIQGDSNRNAVVTVSYRKQGSGTWAAGLPLLRLNGERIYADSRVHVEAPNMFAGSVLDL